MPDGLGINGAAAFGLPGGGLVSPLPGALRPMADARRWLVWRWTEPAKPGGKPDKPPFRADDPARHASTQDPGTWGGFAAAMGAVAAAEADGAGYVLRDDAERVFLDLDDCRDPATGAIADWAVRLVEECGSYAELTPSGRGLRIVGLNEGFRAPVHRAVAMPEGGRVEIFHRCPRYVTVSGRRLPDAPDALRPICDVAADLLLLAQPEGGGKPDAPPSPAVPRSNPDASASPEDVASALAQIPNDDLPWEEWSRVGMAAWRASGGGDAALAAWRAWSAKSAKHSDAACDERWRHWFRSPPARIGFGTLHHLARVANPRWVKPSLAQDQPGAHGTATQGGAHARAADREEGLARLAQGPSSGARHAPAAEWPEPVNFLHQPLAATEIGPRHLPEPLLSFARDTAGRMGTSATAVGLAALVASSAATSDQWQIQPKRHDPTWLEEPRLWGAIVGPPSVLKSPILRATTAPLDRLEEEAAQRQAEDLRRHKAELKRWKADGADPETEPRAPRLTRWLIENATVEAISEVLRDDADARYHTPAAKVLIRQDELSEWIANLDRYRQGGRGGGDRGAYLRLFNGGRFTIDRVQRGGFAVPNWSACLLGGIQPEVIARIAQDAADDGLLQRFLFAVVRHTAPGEDRAPDSAAVERYRALIPALTALHPGAGLDGAPRPVTLTAEGHAHRESIDALARLLAAMPNASARRQAAAGKLPGLFARVALAFHLVGIADARARGAEHGTTAVVQPATTGMAAAFLRDIAVPHLLAADAIMFGTAGEADAEWVAGFVLAQGAARLTLRDLVQHRHAFRAPERRRAVLTALDGMVAFGWLSPEEHLPHAAPTAWSVNPLVHERFHDAAERERERRRRVREELDRLRTGGLGSAEDEE